MGSFLGGMKIWAFDMGPKQRSTFLNIARSEGGQDLSICEKGM
jgi:hypothetical protein